MHWPSLSVYACARAAVSVCGRAGGLGAGAADRGLRGGGTQCAPEQRGPGPQGPQWEGWRGGVHRPAAAFNVCCLPQPTEAPGILT